ncbi:macro domain-containing protein [Aliarcobacter lanthieri]|uniref:macro domain-containing protein n=1 Tax=Aliarcobacter lanthieri TaxID=1355374 RepID=UPI00068FF0CC|nr:macro domain-containing protein [Aliarcobacter lanthieri]QKF58953.1 Macro_Poa1p_like domain-containing protein [Aliarcobacter lanthieri]
MISYIKGNLFTSNAKILVNAVNTVGIMGKGIAADFKRIYPKMFEEYKYLCESKELDIGNLFLYKTQNKWILNFPTKKHWKSPSKLEYIEEGLKKLVTQANELQLNDIAMPKLGCGNGGLDWETQVKPLVEKYLKKSPINVSIYDFDKDIIPEHLTKKDIEKWLNSKPKSINFSIFFEDLKSIFRDNLLSKEIILNNEKYNIEYNEKDEYFIFKSRLKSFIISKEDFKNIFYTLKNLGKLCEADLFSELQQYKIEIFEFLLKLPYILKNVDKLILNYTKNLEEVEIVYELN